MRCASRAYITAAKDLLSNHTHSARTTESRPPGAEMQSSLVESLFAGDPFFERSTVLWPMYRSRFSDVREDFRQRQSALADSFLKELCGLFPYDFLKGSTPALSRGGETRRPSQEGRLVDLSLDVREFSPEDITVKLAGRELAVVAAKQSEDGSTKRKGFVQKIGLPENVDVSAITCAMTPDGLLKIAAPALQQGSSEERTVPIRFRTSLNFPINSSQPDAGKDVPQKTN